MSRVLVFLLLLASPALASNSLLADFHPLGAHARLEPLRACTQQLTSAGERFRCGAGANLTRIDFSLNDAGQAQLSLTLPSGRSLHPTLDPFPTLLQSVWTADLNRDGRPDYVLNVSWNGNGIEGEASVVLFLLSNPASYRASALDTMLFDPHALLRPDAGLPVILQTALVPATDSKGVWHNFWVHHFLRVQGDRLTLSARPPVWVQYKFRPDPHPTQLLSSSQKRRAWTDYTTSGEWRGFLVPVTLKHSP